MEVIDFFEKDRRTEFNTLSYTQAVGWSGLFNGFAGKDGKKNSPMDLLPFKSETTQSNSLSDRTSKILKNLIQENTLHPCVVSVLVSLI